MKKGIILVTIVIAALLSSCNYNRDLSNLNKAEIQLNGAYRDYINHKGTDKEAAYYKVYVRTNESHKRLLKQYLKNQNK